MARRANIPMRAVCFLNHKYRPTAYDGSAVIGALAPRNRIFASIIPIADHAPLFQRLSYMNPIILGFVLSPCPR